MRAQTVSDTLGTECNGMLKADYLTLYIKYTAKADVNMRAKDTGYNGGTNATVGCVRGERWAWYIRVRSVYRCVVTWSEGEGEIDWESRLNK